MWNVDGINPVSIDERILINQSPHACSERPIAHVFVMLLMRRHHRPSQQSSCCLTRHALAY